MCYLAKDLFNQIIVLKGKVMYALLCYIVDHIQRTAFILHSSYKLKNNEFPL